MSSIDKNCLPQYDGGTAYSGALVFFDPNTPTWTSGWRQSYGDLFPSLRFFVGDAFGLLFGLDSSDKVCIFCGETAEVEPLGIDERRFYGIISEDPDGTVHKSFFDEATHAIGTLKADQIFAFKVEMALGGKLAIDNLYITDRIEHMRALGKIACQIHRDPTGTSYEVSRAG
ncbi:DUF1851 domain-containing protein [Massilia pinisoli]|uniref:DUF1851 domain-containing protein n=1 Tax=Massilia pinisoli TaxID=1772194 RepID=A0ABT2A046_9BURK|nr:DUF1851 domain-containing protein [Massilia pinisoli]MCS0585548.1 DUF1851 domain-containing protein [Massilia pinisoli]